MILYINKEGNFSNYDKDLANKVLGEERILTGLVKNFNANMKEAENQENIIIAVTKPQFFAHKDLIFSKIKELSNVTKDIQLVIDGGSAELMDDKYNTAPIEYTYSKNELKEISNIEEDINKLGIKNPVRFNEYFFTRSSEDIKDCWDLNSVVSANNVIDNFVSYIKKHNLSPYETMIAIHKYMLSSFFFDVNVPESGRDLEKNRSIVALIHFDTAKCVGFASFIKTVIDRLNNPNLNCEMMSLVRREKNDQKKYHAICSINIDDPEYEIKGKYFEDPTLDISNRMLYKDNGLAHFLYPVSDLDFDIDKRIIRGAKTSSRVDIGEIENKNDKGRFIPIGLAYWSTFDQGKPIPLSTIKKGLYNYYLKTGEDPEFIDNLIEYDIENSRKNIKQKLSEGTQNPFWEADIEG